ncbi:MAG TPA: hypothetical protein VF048_10920, partial [Gemmatimonadaceae bacterium]
MTAPDSRPALPTRPLWSAMYVVAFGFILPTLMEFLLVSLPPRLGDVRWRFGGVGVLFNTALLPPLIGLTLI